MNKFIKNLDTEQKVTVALLLISGVALIFSLADIKIIKFDFAWIAVLLCGYPIIKGAVEGLIESFDIKADVLVSLALIAAVFIGEIFAAGEVAFIMALGALLEDITVSKARQGIENLIELTPSTARIVRGNEDFFVRAEEVIVGDILRVLPGETIPVDGVIIDGNSSIDQSLMTGEPIPVDKNINDEVMSGTVNQFGSFTMKALKVGENSSIQRMIKLVESADAGKAKIVRLTDKWATWIVVIALISAVGTWFFTGEVIRAVTILVVFCPCSLVLATPTAIMAAIGNVTRVGILVRKGESIEKLAKVTHIAFDKTGTLTYGKPTVVNLVNLTKDYSDEELLMMVASIESHSEHPLGKAISLYHKTMYAITFEKVSDFKMLPGKGVYGTIRENRIFAGNKELLLENSIIISRDLLEKATAFIENGFTLVYLAVNEMAVGFIVLSDVLRKETIGTLKKINDFRINSILLTGDNEKTANYITKDLNISKVYSHCLPEDKLKIIEDYHGKNDLVCMIGDGLNDAPALKKSHVGIAMGNIGSDIAIDAADIVLVHDNIEALPHLFDISKATMKKINFNLSISMILNFLGIILAMKGLLSPIAGALVHNIGSILVVINSAFLMKYKKYI